MATTLTVLSEAELDAVTGAGGDQSNSSTVQQSNNVSGSNVNGNVTQTNQAAVSQTNTKNFPFPVYWPF